MYDCITAYYFRVDGFPKNFLSLIASKKVVMCIQPFTNYLSNETQFSSNATD